MREFLAPKGWLLDPVDGKHMVSGLDQTPWLGNDAVANIKSKLSTFPPHLHPSTASDLHQPPSPHPEPPWCTPKPHFQRPHGPPRLARLAPRAWLRSMGARSGRQVAPAAVTTARKASGRK